MPNSDNIWVVRDKDGPGWAVKREGESNPVSRHEKKQEAVDLGREIRGEDRGELIVQDRHGKIQSRDNAPGSRDPFPPRG